MTKDSQASVIYGGELIDRPVARSVVHDKHLHVDVGLCEGARERGSQQPPTVSGRNDNGNLIETLTAVCRTQDDGELTGFSRDS